MKSRSTRPARRRAPRPAFRLRQWCAVQKRSLIMPARFPLPQREAQPLLPRSEGAVGVHPFPQAVPAADQRFVHDFRRLVARPRRGWSRPSARRPAADQLPIVTQLRAWRQTPRVLGALAGPNQLHEHPPRRAWSRWPSPA